MRNFNYLMMLTALVGFAAFTACERNANPETSQSSAVKFTGGVNDMSKTRAADQTWAADDAIGVFMVRNATPTVVDGAANRQYTTTAGNGTFTPIITTEPASNSTIYYPVDGNDVNFIAYYPYNAAATLNGGVRVEIVPDQNPTGNPVAEVQPTFDLLYAVANSGEGDPVNNYNKGTKTPVAFQFQHKLSKVVFNIEPATGTTDITQTHLDDMTVTINNQIPFADFNLITTNFVFPTSFNAINVVTRKQLDEQAPNYRLSYDAIIFPFNNITAANDVIVSFLISGTEPPAGTYNLNLGQIEFESGNVYTYNVTVTRTGIVVENSTINPWTGGDGISIDAV